MDRNEQKRSKRKSPDLPQVKKILRRCWRRKPRPVPASNIDYVNKFSKVDPDKAEEILQTLVKEYEIEEAEAVQIVNCMPETVDELRVFFAGGRKIIETSKLQSIVALLNENRTLK